MILKSKFQVVGTLYNVPTIVAQRDSDIINDIKKEIETSIKLNQCYKLNMILSNRFGCNIEVFIDDKKSHIILPPLDVSIDNIDEQDFSIDYENAQIVFHNKVLKNKLKFYISISKNYSLESLLFVLLHEVGHIFYFFSEWLDNILKNQKRLNAKSILYNFLNPMDTVKDDAIEIYADDFANKMLALTPNIEKTSFENKNSNVKFGTYLDLMSIGFLNTNALDSMTSLKHKNDLELIYDKVEVVESSLIEILKTTNLTNKEKDAIIYQFDILEDIVKQKLNIIKHDVNISNLNNQLLNNTLTITKNRF